MLHLNAPFNLSSKVGLAVILGWTESPHGVTPKGHKSWAHARSWDHVDSSSLWQFLCRWTKMWFKPRWACGSLPPCPLLPIRRKTKDWDLFFRARVARMTTDFTDQVFRHDAHAAFQRHCYEKSSAHTLEILAMQTSLFMGVRFLAVPLKAPYISQRRETVTLGGIWSSPIGLQRYSVTRRVLKYWRKHTNALSGGYFGKLVVFEIWSSIRKLSWI